MSRREKRESDVTIHSHPRQPARGGYRAALPVPETYFEFNAIVQNQLPRSSRNIRAKFTAESVLRLARTGGIGRSCRAILETLTHEIIAALIPVTSLLLLLVHAAKQSWKWPR